MDDFSGNRAKPGPARASVALAGLIAVLSAGSEGLAAAAKAPPPPPPAAEPAKPAEKAAEPQPPRPTRVKPPPVAPRVPRMLSDVNTGLALGGYDPVAYFVEGTARPGKIEYEVDWRGAAWRFVNEGNMAAFKESPEVYAPRFVGHDAFQVARGFLAEASPFVYLVLADRLYLFASVANRLAFLMNAEEEMAAAEKAWPLLARDLP